MEERRETQGSVLGALSKAVGLLSLVVGVLVTIQDKPQVVPAISLLLFVYLAAYALFDFCDAIGRTVVRAEEPVADVHPRLRQELPAKNGAEYADQDGHLDRAGGVKPSIGVIVEVGARLEVGDGDRHR